MSKWKLSSSLLQHWPAQLLILNSPGFPHSLASLPYITQPFWLWPLCFLATTLDLNSPGLFPLPSALIAMLSLLVFFTLDSSRCLCLYL